MRNHLKQWLNLLRWASFITLLAAGILTYCYQSPLGNLYKLDQKLASWLNISNPSTLNYTMLGIATLLCLGGLCSFRCGNTYKRKYAFPLALASLTLLASLVIYAIETPKAYIPIATWIIPIATPFLLLRYQVWKNQVDHWSVLVSILIALTLCGYAYQCLTNTTGFPTPVGPPIKVSGFTSDLNTLLITSAGYIAIAVAISLFIVSLRRLALYLTIILAFTISGSSLASCFCSANFSYTLCQGILITLLTVSYWLLPILILFSLASQSKTRTLKL